MIYRIHFIAYGGYFTVQFQRFFLFWETVQVGTTYTSKQPFDDLRFQTYDEAEKWVKERGIDRAYTRHYSMVMEEAMVPQRRS